MSIHLKLKNVKSFALHMLTNVDQIVLKTHTLYKVNKEKIVDFHESPFRKKYEPVECALVFMLRGINYNLE